MYKLIVCIYACDTIPKYQDQIFKVKETYEKTASELFPNDVKILFFLGEEVILDDHNFIHLKGVKNDYLSASYKQYYGLKYIYENYDAEFIIAVGTDTYINIPKTLELLSKFDHNKSLYIGGYNDMRIVNFQWVEFFDGNGGVIITKEFLKTIYPIIKDVDKFMEDWIYICSLNKNIDLKCGCDVSIACLARDLKATYVKVEGINNIHHFKCDFEVIKNLNPVYTCANLTLEQFNEYKELLKENNYFLNE